MKFFTILNLIGIVLASKTLIASDLSNKQDISLQFNVNGKITAEQIQNLSYTRIQALRQSYVNFLKKVQLDQKVILNEKDVLIETTSFNHFEKYFVDMFSITNANAADGDICFFGGWPSKQFGPYCEAPWKHSNDNALKTFGETYALDKFRCGSGQFRCNPILFGKPNENDSGYCVKTQKPYANLTNACEAASIKNIDQLNSDLKNDPNKAAQLAKFNEAIFGSSDSNGFCQRFKNETGKDYDACDALKRRIAALTDPLSDGQVPTDKQLPDESQSPPKTNIVPHQSYMDASDALNACQKYLEENSTRDVNGRKMLETFQDGLVKCIGASNNNSSSPYTITEQSLNDIKKSLDTITYLKELSLKDFEYKLQALMNNAYVFSESLGRNAISIDDKDNLKNKLKGKFPNLTGEDYNAVFENIYKKFQENKKSIVKIDSNEAIKNLKHFANSENFTSLFGTKNDTQTEGVNGVCRRIYDEFKEKHDYKKWSYGLEHIRSYSQDEENSINQYREILNTSIDTTFNKSKVGFLLGTEVFKERIMDTSVDLVKECISNPTFNVLNSNPSAIDFKNSLKEAQNKILDSFSNLNDNENVIFEGKTKNAIEKIQSLMKENKFLLKDSLLISKDNDRKNKAIFLCSQINEIYSDDELIKGAAWVGAGTSIIGGALCLFPLTSALGCPVAVLGTVIGASSGGHRAYESYNQQKESSDIQLSQDLEASTYNQIDGQAQDQFESGATEVVLSATGAVAGAVKKISKVIASRKVAETSSNTQKTGLKVIEDTVPPTSNTTNKAINVVDDVVSEPSSKALINNANGLVEKANKTQQTGQKATSDAPKSKPKSKNPENVELTLDSISKMSAEDITKITPYEIAKLSIEISKALLKKKLGLNKLPSEIIEKISKTNAERLLKEILGINSDVTKLDVRRLIQKLHPDKLPEGFPKSIGDEQMRVLGELLAVI